MAALLRRRTTRQGEMQRRSSRAPVAPFEDPHATRETIERSEINATVLMTGCTGLGPCPLAGTRPVSQVHAAGSPRHTHLENRPGAWRFGMLEPLPFRHDPCSRGNDAAGGECGVALPVGRRHGNHEVGKGRREE